MWFPRNAYWYANGRPDVRYPRELNTIGNLSHGRLGWLISSINDCKTDNLIWWLRKSSAKDRQEARRHGITIPVILTHGWRFGHRRPKVSESSGYRLVSLYGEVPGVPGKIVADILFQCDGVGPAIRMHLLFPNVISRRTLLRRIDRDAVLFEGRHFSGGSSRPSAAYRLAIRVPELRALIDADQVMRS